MSRSPHFSAGVFGAALACLAACSHDPEPVAVDPKNAPPIALPKRTLEKLSTFELDNHVRIVVEENHSAPVVSLQAWVRAGAADEQKPGVAQLTQRLLLRGSKKHGDAVRQIETVGGEVHGYTTLDSTVLSTTLASRFFDLATDVVSDALLQPTFEDAIVKKEVSTQRAEIFANAQKSSTRISELLFDTAFSQHPYKRAIAPGDADLGKLVRDDVVKHFERFYRGANLTLIVSGDVQAQAARDRLERAFKPMAAGVPSPARTVEPEPTGARHATATSTGEQVNVALGWRIPSIDHVDSFALDLLSVVLGQGESSRLYSGLVRSNQATDTYAFTFAGRDPGLITVGFASAPGKIDKVVQDVFEQVATLRSDVISSAELARAKKIILTDELYERETVSGGARKLGFFASVLGDAGYSDRYVAKLAAVTAEDLRVVANRYLTADRLTAVVVAPKTSEPKSAGVIAAAQRAEQRIAKTTPAQQAKAGPLGVTKLTLPSGATLLIQEDHRLPLVAVRALYPGGLRYENARTNGVNALMALLITRGTKRQKSDQLVADLEELGAKLEGFSGHNVFGVRAELTKQTFEPAFEIIGEMLATPLFDSEELDRERPALLEEIRARADNSSTLAVDLFTETLFDASPLRMRPTGTVESVSALKVEDLQAFYAKHYTRDRLVLAVVGDVSVNEVSQQAERLFGRPLERTDLLAPVIDGPLLQARHIERTRERGAANALVGVRGLPSRHADRPALELLAAVLTRPGGRLSALSDSQGLARRVDGVFIDSPEGGYMASFLATTPDKLTTALQAAQAEWQKLTKSPIDSNELDAARRYLIGTRARRVETLGGRASSFALGEAYGLGYDFDAHFDDKLAALTAAELMRVAATAFAPEQLVTVAVKPQ